MKKSRLDSLLKRWGRMFGEGASKEWDEPSSYGMGGLAEKMQQYAELGAGVSAPAPTRDANGRPIIKTWGARCFGVQTRGGQRKVPLADNTSEFIERMCYILYKDDRLKGVILRIEYCTRGTQEDDKLPRVQEIMRHPHLKISRYRDELRRARAYMEGAICVAGML